MRKRVNILIGLGLMALFISCHNPERQSGTVFLPERPLNVLFIAVDDLRPELGAYGHTEIHSPNIDRLAREGLVFDRAYVQQAVCSPSRTSLLTGLRPDSTHVYDLTTHFRSTVPQVITLPQFFRQNGYYTTWWGKIFHAGLLDSLSWTEQGERLEPKNNWRAYVLENNKQLAARNNGAGPPYERVPVADNAYPDGQIADHAIESLRRLKDQPFFLAVGFYKPHLPFKAPERYWGLYDTTEKRLPERDRYPDGAPEIAFSNWEELRNYYGVPPKGPVGLQMAQSLIQGYRACISYTDAQIGRLLDELDRLGLSENTIVILWGDHGWKLGDYGAWCKHTNYEVDTRAPLIIRAPRMKARDRHTAALVEMVDIYPSLAEIAGLPVPRHVQGTSFAPLLDDPDLVWKDVALSQYPRRNGAAMGYSMRTTRYRFTRWQSTSGQREVIAYELYDHNTDRGETQNLGSSEEQRTLILELDSLLEKRWRESLEIPAQ